MAEEHLLEIPIIDLSSANAASQIRQAHEEFGFFHVVNHGVPVELLGKALDLQKDFFAASDEYKSKFGSDKGYRSEGYNAAPSRSTFGMQIRREHLYLFLQPLWRRNPAKWPDSHRDVIQELGKSCIQVYEKLIAALSQALNIDPLCMRDALCPDDLKQTFCTFWYPRNETDEEAFGIPEHNDIGTLVLLFADDVPSLQVLRDGKWFTIKPVPDSFVVSLGEILEVMSNGKYRSTVHRVLLNKDRERCSCAVTFEPSQKAHIGPLVREENQCYRRFLYEDRYREYEEGKYPKEFAMLSPPVSASIQTSL